MAQVELVGILEEDRQGLVLYYGLGDKYPYLCTKYRFPSQFFQAVYLI